MTTIFTVHADGAPERLRRDVECLVALGIGLVTPVTGPISRVQAVLADPAGMAQRAVAAYVVLAGAPLDPDQRTQEVRAFTRICGGNDGLSVPLPDGGALVLFNSRLNTTVMQFAKPVLHELVHASQFDRPGVRARVAAHLRRAYGIDPQQMREEAAHERLLAAEEREAYAAENQARALITAFTTSRLEAVR